MHARGNSNLASLPCVSLFNHRAAYFARERSARISGVSPFFFRVVNMLGVRMEWEREAKERRKRGGKWNWEEDELWDVFSLAAIIIICSVVITALGVCCLDQTADGGGQWSSCTQSSSHLCKLPLFNRRMKRRRKRSQQRRRMWEKEEERYRSKWYQENRFTGSEVITPT